MFEIEAKKSLGQNFLKNRTIIERIVAAGNIEKGDTILEIGPGTGAMTEVILEHIARFGTDEKAGKLILIEKDRRAIPILEAKFKGFLDKKQLRIIEGDFLEAEIGDILGNFAAKNGKKPGKRIGKTGRKASKQPKTYKTIANIPYYITGAIIRRCLEAEIKPETAIFLVQKEVAERITRKETSSKGQQKSNILAESISAYGKAEYLFTVVKGNFVPIPRVDSAAIRISDISDRQFAEHGVSEAAFFEVMKAGFAHKRKKAISNLKDFLQKNEKTAKMTAKAQTNEIISKIESILSKTAKKDGDNGEKNKETGENIRAEEIHTETWFQIAEIVQKTLQKESR
jgi:16S rRNA (adenine1518-N6/adenine1519-N6)-dimethyltransferase